MEFTAFTDDTASLTIDNLCFENQSERLSIYGSIQIYQDQQGLAYAKKLRDLLAQTVSYLEQQELPQCANRQHGVQEIDNPFWDEK